MITLSAIRNQVSSLTTCTFNRAVSAGRSIGQLGSNVYASVSPKLAPVISRITSLNFSSVFAAAKTFCKSDAGVSIGLIGVGLVSLALCDKPYQVTAKTVALTVIASLAMVGSATVMFKPVGLAALSLIRR